MKLHAYFFIACSLCLWACGGNKQQSSETTQTIDGGDERPNIIVVLVDDMGYSDIGCFGGEINTPNIDRLAKGGMRYTNFYNAARCCPSRASLITGLYPHQAGMGFMEKSYEHPNYLGHLKDSSTTIAEVLREEGYNTYHVGKWHMGNDEEQWPKHKGFDKDFTFVNGATSYYNLAPYRAGSDSMKMCYNGERYRPTDENFYMTDAFTDHAVKFIQEDDEKPFFMYLAYTAPHWPLHALPEDIARYKGKYDMGWDSLRVQRYERMKALGIIEGDIELSERFSGAQSWSELTDEEKEDWSMLMTLYAACLDRMDQGLGKVIGQLEAQGELENTLILFLSDNGGCAENMRKVVYPQDGEPGSERSFPTYNAPWANASNTPYRFFKAWLQEGGMRTPLVAHWPAKIKPEGLDASRIGHIMDIMPTCLEAAGATYPSQINGRPVYQTTGESFMPSLLGEPQHGHDSLYWEHSGARAVRIGQWKAVANNWKDGVGVWRKWELFDLANDPIEANDLSEQYPDRLAALTAAYDNWTREIGVFSPEGYDSLRAAQKARDAKKALKE